MNHLNEKSSNPGGKPTPGEEQIEYLLSRIQPTPSVKFHKRMATTPWNRTPQFRLLTQLRSLGLPAILVISLVLIFIIVLVSPSLGVLANRIARFFTPATSNRVLIQVPMEDLITPEARFSNTIPEAAELAGFTVKTPSEVPNGYTLSGAAYNSERGVVTINYVSESGFVLRISQRPLGVEYQTISVNATVDRVKIGSIAGEYVTGGWVAAQPHGEDPTSKSTVTLQAVWDPDANIHFLRWQDNDILYEIIFSGDNPVSNDYLHKEDLINIAEGLQ